MSIIARLDGLPGNAESNSVILAVRKILQKLKIKFWASEFKYSAQTKTKKCKIEFFDKKEVPKAIEKLTSKPQTIIGIPCDLKIEVLKETFEDDAVNQEGRRDRSRSPVRQADGSLDKEIQQLNKEKLQLEKRKSLLLQKKKNFDQEGHPMWHSKLDHHVLPKSTSAENFIFEQMKPAVKAFLKKRYYQMVLGRLHVEIRKRLAILIDENQKLQSKVTGPRDIVKAYRSVFNKADDAQTIETVIQEIKLAFWAYKAKNNDGVKSDQYDYDDSTDDEDVIPVQKQADNETGENDNGCGKPNITEETTHIDDEPEDLDMEETDEVHYKKGKEEEHNKEETEDHNNKETEEEHNKEETEEHNNKETEEEHNKEETEEEHNKEEMEEEHLFEGGTDWNDEGHKEIVSAS